jgi:hypothetical protein
MSVCPSARPHEQLGSYWTDFNYIWYFSTENLSRKFKFHFNLTRITRNLHEGQYAFMITSRSILIGMRNI